MPKMKFPIQIINDILSLIYPDRCVGCGCVLKHGGNVWVCDDCRYHFEIRDYKKCSKCGRILYHMGKCRVCNSEKQYFDKGHTLFEYKEAVRYGIREFKYKGMFRYGKFFGELMAEYANKNLKTKFDYVTSVPLHNKRYKSRGYNQSEILAKIVAKNINFQYKNIIERCINTTPQSKLNKKQRFENIKGAFNLKSNVCVKDKNILIIDDIFTSGSTINECSKVLKKNGAGTIEFLTLSCRSED